MITIYLNSTVPSSTKVESLLDFVGNEAKFLYDGSTMSEGAKTEFADIVLKNRDKNYTLFSVWSRMDGNKQARRSWFVKSI